MGQYRADGTCVAPLNGTAVVGSPTGAPGREELESWREKNYSPARDFGCTNEVEVETGYLGLRAVGEPNFAKIAGGRNRPCCLVHRPSPFEGNPLSHCWGRTPSLHGGNATPCPSHERWHRRHDHSRACQASGDNCGLEEDVFLGGLGSIASWTP